MLKVIGGQYKSRHLKTPKDSETTRPWTGRARESVFNQLRGHIPDGAVLDLFAGVGTMGLEAASRGAKAVVMIERDRKVMELLQNNIQTLGCSEQVQAVSADALGSVPLLRSPKPLDVAFVDPPYAMMSDDGMRQRILEQIAKIGELLADDGYIVLRSPINPHRVDHTIQALDGPELHKHGAGMWVLFYGKRTL
jgi:16S rRNA (guanine966-N2)-methyltransferase